MARLNVPDSNPALNVFERGEHHSAPILPYCVIL